jgi:hypothetical protein
LHGLIAGHHHLGHWKDALKENPTRFVEAYIALVEHRNLFSHAAPLA